MTVIGLKKTVKKAFFFKQKGTGFMEVYLQENPDKSSEILFKSLKYALDEINKEYPENLKIITEEKNGS